MDKRSGMNIQMYIFRIKINDEVLPEEMFQIVFPQIGRGLCMGENSMNREAG